MTKSEIYTPQLKAYLTFENSPITRGIFLNETYRTEYKVIINRTILYEYTMPIELEKEIKKIGGQVEIIKTPYTSGKNEIRGIFISVRKIFDKRKFTGIRVRVIGENISELMDRVESIKSMMSEYSIKPKVCLWDRVIT